MLCVICGVNEATLIFSEVDMYCSISCKLHALDLWGMDGHPGKYDHDIPSSANEVSYDFDEFALMEFNEDWS